MTNTLHRYGDADSFRDDYIIFAIPCRGKNDEGAVEKLKTFLTLCLKHHPVNVGNSDFGSFRPAVDLHPAVHWRRPLEADHRDVVAGIHRCATVTAVFDTFAKATACLREVVAADLGLSINVSQSVEGARRLAEACGIKRHSVEYSLGFGDPHDNLPNREVLHLSTMCGHSMISSKLAEKMLEMVREGRRSPDEAAVTLARFCPCGAFNPARARRLLDQARDSG